MSKSDRPCVAKLETYETEKKFKYGKDLQAEYVRWMHCHKIYVLLKYLKRKQRKSKLKISF